MILLAVSLGFAVLLTATALVSRRF